MKIVVNPSLAINAASLAADTTFSLPELFDFYGISLQFKFVDLGSLAGSLSMEVTNRVSPTTGLPEDWVAYTGFAAITSFASQIWFIDNKIFPFKHARLNWNQSAGDGNMSVTMAACRP